MFSFQTTGCDIIVAAFRLLGLVPRIWAFRVGNLLGHIIFLADRKHRGIVLSNLSHAFGNEKKPGEIRLLARQVFRNLGQILFEMGWSWRLNREDFPKHFRIVGLSNLANAFKKNRGVLALTAHVGNWELLTNIGAMIDYPLSIVVRPLDFEPLDRFFEGFRTRFGGKLIPTKYSMRMVMRSLNNKDMVAMLMDQNVDWYDGTFVDFFGRLACTNKGMALLALKTGAPVIPVFLVRDQMGFVAEFGPEVPLARTGDKTKDVETNTHRYNKVLESFIRRYPDQWFWVHQRWKTRPYHKWPRG
jgi:KDO2-lipid IV(A) lauroyltransferase